MYYKCSIANEEVFVKIPNDLNQKMALNVLFHETAWSNLGEEVPPEDIEVVDFAELLDPNLFVHIDGEEYWSGDTKVIVEGDPQPDMEYFSMIDQDFFEKMIYHWSKVDDYEVQSFLDEIDEHVEEIACSAFVRDILE